MGKAIDVEQKKQQDALQRKKQERRAALEKARAEQERIEAEKR